MNVEFSEIALAGLRKALSDEDERENYKLAIKFFLKAKDAERYAYPLEAYPDKQMYLRPLDNLRITYELVTPGNPILVWSIKPLSGR